MDGCRGCVVRDGACEGAGGVIEGERVERRGDAADDGAVGGVGVYARCGAQCHGVCVTAYYDGRGG